MRAKKLLALLLLLLACGPVLARAKVRISCVGNSITFGHGLPDQAQHA